MHMARKRTTLNLDEELLREAQEFSGIHEKTALIHQALRELVQRAAVRHLVAMGGTMPDFEIGRGRSTKRR